MMLVNHSKVVGPEEQNRTEQTGLKRVVDLINFVMKIIQKWLTLFGCLGARSLSRLPEECFGPSL